MKGLGSRSSDRALVATGVVAAAIAAICCAAPLLAALLPLAAFIAWTTHAGLVVILPITLAGLALVAWNFHRRQAKATGCKTTNHKEGVKL